MPKPAVRAANPYIAKWMDDHPLVKDLKEAAPLLGVPYTTLVKVAKDDYSSEALAGHYNIAKSLGISLDDWAKSVLNI